jgi:iron complex transport system ATP-binding protein
MTIKIRALSLLLDANHIIRSLNLDLDAGKIYGLIGPNGAGKSSLLKILSRELDASTGIIQVLGKDITSWTDRDYACQVSVLPQFSQLNFPLTVAEVLSFSRLPHSTSREQNRTAISEVTKLLDLEQLINRHYTELSGGEKQRVQLARVLAQLWQDQNSFSGILLLDEPTNSLDIEHQHALLRCLGKIVNEDLCIVLVLHDLSLGARYCDQLIMLANGQVVASGPPKKVITEDLLRLNFNLPCTVSLDPQRGHPIISV